MTNIKSHFENQQKESYRIFSFGGLSKGSVLRTQRRPLPVLEDSFLKGRGGAGGTVGSPAREGVPEGGGNLCQCAA